MSVRLTTGNTAPAFTLPNAVGEPVSLSDYGGKQVILYFYPAAMTPGCTTQAVDFTESMGDLSAAGYSVIGVSPDSVERLAKFTDSSNLTFPLLADPEKATILAYGAFGTKKLYGKEIEGIIRSTFVIDVDEAGVGTVRIAQYNVKATGHVAKLRRELGV